MDVFKDDVFQAWSVALATWMIQPQYPGRVWGLL